MAHFVVHCRTKQNKKLFIGHMTVRVYRVSVLEFYSDGVGICYYTESAMILGYPQLKRKQIEAI